VALAAPSLSETTRNLSIPATLAVYWHLLSLDAPTVAAVWSWSFARAAHIDLPRFAPLLLAVGTWLVYVTDRILDGLDRANREYLRERHHFYSEHRKAFLAANAVVCPIFLWFVFTRMSPAARLEDSAVFAVAALYFLLVHAHGAGVERWLPKELAVGTLFAAATAVPTWSRIAGHRLALVPVVALFALLCWLNCVAIEAWEGTPATRAGAHSTTVWVGRHLQELAAGTALLSIGLAATHFRADALFCLYLASAMAALLLLWLARSNNFTAIQLRVAVDAVLLTPLLFTAWMR
jgi:hypothetical protein